MVHAFHGDAGRVIDMQVDAEGGRILRWPTQADRLLVPGLVHNSLNRNPETGEPGFQIPWGAAR